VTAKNRDLRGGRWFPELSEPPLGTVLQKLSLDFWMQLLYVKFEVSTCFAKSGLI